MSHAALDTMSDINNEQTELMRLAHLRCCSSSIRRRHHQVVSLIAVACFIFPAISAESNHASFNSSYLSSAIKIVREIKLNHSHLPEYDQVVAYEKLIYGCLSKITSQMELCVYKVSLSNVQSTVSTATNSPHTDTVQQVI